MIFEGIPAPKFIEISDSDDFIRANADKEIPIWCQINICNISLMTFERFQ